MSEVLPLLAGEAVVPGVGEVLMLVTVAGVVGYGIYHAISSADKEHADAPPSTTQDCPKKDADDAEPDAENPPATAARPPISRQKQDGHIRGTPQNENRLKQGKPTSTFDGDAAQADELTQEAWEKGKPVPGRPGVRDYDFGHRIGEGPDGGGQSTVRVHEDATGRIHGHPSGRVTP